MLYSKVWFVLKVHLRIILHNGLLSMVSAWGINKQHVLHTQNYKIYISNWNARETFPYRLYYLVYMYNQC